MAILLYLFSKIKQQEVVHPAQKFIQQDAIIIVKI